MVNFHVSDTTLSMSEVLLHFTCATANYYLHFTGEKTEEQWS